MCGNTGNSPWAARPDKPLLALGSMHTHEQRANTAKLTKISVPCLTHKQCPRWAAPHPLAALLLPSPSSCLCACNTPTYLALLRLV